MRKIITIIILILMVMFSLSAEEILKTRYVEGNIFDGPAEVWLVSDETETEVGVRIDYFVAWFEKDGSDVVSVYECNSIEDAYNVWLMSRYSIESNRQIKFESVEGINGKLCLVRSYDIK